MTIIPFLRFLLKIIYTLINIILKYIIILFTFGVLNISDPLIILFFNYSLFHFEQKEVSYVNLIFLSDYNNIPEIINTINYKIIKFQLEANLDDYILLPYYVIYIIIIHFILIFIKTNINVNNDLKNNFVERSNNFYTHSCEINFKSIYDYT